GKMQSVNIHITGRDGEAGCYLALHTKLGLFGVGVLVVGLAGEDHAERRNRAAVGDVDSEGSEISRSYAGCLTGCGRGALHPALRKQRLEDRGGVRRWRQTGYAG